MAKLGEWGVAEKLLPRAPKASQLARVDLAAAVDKELATSNFDWKSVKVRG